MKPKNEPQSTSEASLENFILKSIPLTSAIGVKVNLASPERVVLNAPFSKNFNHKMTVFGGSLSAVATLACWSLLHIRLAELDDKKIEVVISKSEADYLAPVTSDFEAECTLPDMSEWERFLKILNKKGKARLRLHAKIFQNNALCVDFTGTFVALVIK